MKRYNPHSNKPHHHSHPPLQAIQELRTHLGDDAISTDPSDLYDASHSPWSTINLPTTPAAIAYPRTTADVSLIAQISHRHKIPLIPLSGNTSTEGQTASPHPSTITISFAHMSSLLSTHPADLTATVQPGLPLATLNASLAPHNLFFPIDPAPTACIGGMLGTSCSGTNAVRHATMKESVVALTVVLADGRVIRTRGAGRPRKSAAGYNLTNLFVGAEGTLGIITEATLKLAVVPARTRVAVVPFRSVRDAAAAAAAVVRAGVPVAAMEMMDEVQMGVINRVGATGRRWDEAPTVFFKFAGRSEEGVEEDVGAVRAIVREHAGGDFLFAASEAEQVELWSARKEALWSMLALKGEGEEIWSTDVAVPLSRLAEIIEESKKDISELGMFASMLGHVGDGNFHAAIFYNKKDPEQVEKVKRVVYKMVDRALEMEGTCTGEVSVRFLFEKR